MEDRQELLLRPPGMKLPKEKLEANFGRITSKVPPGDLKKT
jgi:hypothetical protein